MEIELRWRGKLLGMLTLVFMLLAASNACAALGDTDADYGAKYGFGKPAGAGAIK